jgi:hypothetical protein
MSFFLPEDSLFDDPSRATPENTHITELGAEPYPDGYRLRVNLAITPFQTRPYLEITVRDAAGEEVASASFVEPMTWKLEFTMHIRSELNNPYTLEARLFYPEGPSDDPRRVIFEIKPPASQAEDSQPSN